MRRAKKVDKKKSQLSSLRCCVKDGVRREIKERRKNWYYGYDGYEEPVVRECRKRLTERKKLLPELNFSTHT
jgi:hypothetical protein